MHLVPAFAAILKSRLSPEKFDRIKALFQATIQPDKYSVEIDYWRARRIRHRGCASNGHYRQRMLRLARRDIRFFEDKVVCDFGCGPNGSLQWLGARATCIGLDVLADRYFDEFGAEMAEHRMLYIRTTERRIPLPTAFCDVMFTMNALDHVADLPCMCGEIVRVMKPGGWLFAQFSLYERRTVTEPQTLDPSRLESLLLQHFAEDYRESVPKADGSEKLPVGPRPAVLSFAGTRK